MKASADGIIEDDDQILLVRRDHPPYEGSWALPGGMLEDDETLEDCVVREVREEVGIDSEVDYLVGVYSEPDRDPRGRVVTAAYALDADDPYPEPGEEVQEADWFSLDDLPDLAFDHDTILEEYKKTRE